MNQRESQEKQILGFLMAGNRLTALTALSLFQTLRLSGRIHSLRQSGYDIKSRTVKTSSGKHVSEYFITPKETLFEL